VTDPGAAAAAFIDGPGPIEPLPGGHIHESWLVAGPGGRVVVQRCNTTVFPDLDRVMLNVTLVLDTLGSALRPLRTIDGGVLWRPGDGSVWRAFPYLEDTVAGAPVADPDRARVLGAAFGAFHRDLAGLDPDRLAVTLPGFHDPGRRLAALDRAAGDDRVGRRSHVSSELASVASLTDVVRPGASVLSGLPRRVAHFDAKADNVLLDARTGQVRAIVDLDTVMPGSVLWDVGDLARSATGPDAEDETDLEAVTFDAGRWGALVDGYLSTAGGLLSAAERGALMWAGPVVTFEQAVRFLTDHLDGDRYYRVERPGHNLDRCRCQLALLRSMLAQPSAMIGP
jgi:N-acetylhexosamine 1-kinase